MAARPEKFARALRESAEFASASYPHDRQMRVDTFVAYLSGMLRGPAVSEQALSEAVFALFDDVPAPPSAGDRAALEVAHRMLRATAPLDDMLENPALRLVLRAVARRHMKRRAQVDLKKLAANDLEDHP